jgi:hypothetical protein
MTSKIVVYQFRKKHPCPWLSGFIQAAAKDFDLIIEEFDETKPYSPDTVFTLEPKDYRKKVYPQWFHDYKIIVNLNGESFADPWIDLYSEDKNILFIYGSKPVHTPSNNVIFTPHFFWIDTCWDWLNNNINAYIPKKTYNKKFLMPVRNVHGAQAEWKPYVFNKLRDKLDNALYSYWDEDIFLPGDAQGHVQTQNGVREIRYDWFDDTYYSLTLESYYSHLKPVFLTEKIYKPLAFYHPFMVIGAPGILKELEDLGFQTFENLFDQSYDTVPDIDDKLKIIRNNIDNFKYVEYDTLTWEKVRHNHNTFFNKETIIKMTIDEFIVPTINWINS